MEIIKSDKVCEKLCYNDYMYDIPHTLCVENYIDKSKQFEDIQRGLR